MSEMVNIPGRLHDVSSDHVVSGANEIYDDALNKKQSQINQEAEIPVLAEAPDENTLTYGTSPNTKNFAINQLCKVADEDNKFTYYRLHNIANNKAVWVEEATTSSDYYNVVIIDNQNGEDIANAKLTYNKKQYSNGNKIKVAKDTVISLSDLSATDVTNYKKTITIIDKTITVLYQTEKVAVTVNTDENGVNAEGQVVTINGTDYTVPSTGVVTAKIPFDTIYSIGVNSWAGQDEYTSPESQSNITANASTRNITMTYLKVRFKTYNLVVTDDQNGSYSSDAQITVKYTVDGVETTLGTFENGDTFTVPINSTVKLIGSAIEDAYPDVELNNSTYTVSYRIVCVDLGNGVKWATGNLSKDTLGNYYIAKPNQNGSYFSWGDIEGHCTNAAYPYDYYFTQSRYNNGDSGEGHNLTNSFESGDPVYDAARANLGENWRIPTYDEISWLVNSCTWTFKLSPVKGFEVTGTNGNKIFLKIPGQLADYTNPYSSHIGGYLSTAQSSQTSANILFLGYYEQKGDSVHKLSTIAKYAGSSIRPVKNVPQSSYIINQTNPSANASSMIEGSAAKDSNDYDSVIHKIHSATKLYGAQLNLVNNKLQVKEISRSNKLVYTDGTSVDVATTDIFMKLPEFWWKCETVSTDKYRVSFTMTNPNSNNWNHWDGKTFIGVYKAYFGDGSKLYSRSGVTPANYIQQSILKASARARGNGFQLVTYEAHQIMCLLGWGWLGTTDAQSVVGRGSTNNPKTTGFCNLKGINDTEVDVDGGPSIGSTSDDISINFWGLENWWGDMYECIDNIETANATGLININNVDGTVKRTVQWGADVNSGNCIGKMVFGTNGDVIPKEVHSDDSYATGFASYGSVNNDAGYVGVRSYYGSSIRCGLGYLSVGISSDLSTSNIGSRLLYNGEYDVL